jgi:hypothetical protein
MIRIYLLDANNDTVASGVKLFYHPYGSGGNGWPAIDSCDENMLTGYINPDITDPGITGTIARGNIEGDNGERKWSGPALDRTLDGSNNYMVINGLPSGTYTFVAVAEFSKYFNSPDDTVKYQWAIDRTTDMITCAGPTPAPVPPAAPQSADVDASGSTVILTWDAVPGATHYEISRFIQKGGSFSVGGPNKNVDELAKAIVTGTVFSDSKIKEAKNIKFKGQTFGNYIIRAFNGTVGSNSSTGIAKPFKL